MRPDSYLRAIARSRRSFSRLSLDSSDLPCAAQAAPAPAPVRPQQWSDASTRPFPPCGSCRSRRCSRSLASIIVIDRQFILPAFGGGSGNAGPGRKTFPKWPKRNSRPKRGRLAAELAVAAAAAIMGAGCPRPEERNSPPTTGVSRPGCAAPGGNPGGFNKRRALVGGALEPILKPS